MDQQFVILSIFLLLILIYPNYPYIFKLTCLLVFLIFFHYNEFTIFKVHPKKMTQHLTSVQPFEKKRENISNLPDEILLEIFQFSSSNPRQLMIFSSICKNWKQVTNSPHAFKYTHHLYLDISPRNCIDEVWHFFLKQFNDYIIPEHYLVKHQCPYEHPPSIFRKNHARSYISVTSRDHLVELKKIHVKNSVDGQRFRRMMSFLLYEYNWRQKMENRTKCCLFSLLTIVLIVASIGLGLIGSLPKEERNYDTGLWWLPFLFIPFQILVIASVVVGIVNVVFSSVQNQWTNRSSLQMAILAILGWLSIGLKYQLYELAGVELTAWQQFLFPKAYFVYLFPLIVIFALLLLNNIMSYPKSWYDIVDITSWSCCEISLFLFSFLRHVVDSSIVFYPMLFAGMLQILREIIRNERNSTELVIIPFGFTLFLSCLVHEFYNYWSLLPLIYVCGRNSVEQALKSLHVRKKIPDHIFYQ